MRICLTLNSIRDIGKFLRNEISCLDVLYNNIGGGWVELNHKLHEVSKQAYDRIVASNLTAIYNTSRAAIIQMLKQGSG